jgi:hypothetical protein
MLRAMLAVCLGALLALPAPAAAPPPAEQWIVVTASDFRAAVEPLAAHRRKQGMRVVVLDVGKVLSAREIRLGDARKLRARLKQRCRDHAGASYILLVGALSTRGFLQPEGTVVPALEGTIGRMKGEPSDGGYGCLNDTRLPSVAVGRMPARTREEARAMVQKTLALERDQKPGAWKRRLTILAGIPAYNPLVDRLVENLAVARFDRLHPIWSGRAIYTNPLSRFALPGDQMRKQALAYLAEGQAFTLYLGHSSAEGLYGGKANFLDRQAWERLVIPRGTGVFITFGCNGCQFRGEDGEGYGIAAIRNPRGPAAVLGSHGICFASMVQLAADGLFHRAFQGPLPRRLGPCWLALLNGVATGKIDALTYRILDAVDGDSRTPQATQRQEHLEMFALLGDPALRLPEMLSDIHLDPVPALLPGKTLLVRGALPDHLHGARVRVTLERSPGSLPDGLVPLPHQPRAKRDSTLFTNHRIANNFTVSEKEVTAKAGAFTARLDVPARLPWPRLTLRVHASTEKSESMVVERLNVTRPRTPGGR